MLRFVLLLVAVLSGGAAAWIAMHLRPQPQEAVAAVVEREAPGAPTIQVPEVLVASGDLRPAQALSKDSMRWQPWPQDALSPVYITRAERPDAVETLSGLLVRSWMSNGEPIRNENLAPRNSGFLAAILPAGKRAAAVRISAESAAGHFVVPSSRVDVLHTDGENVTRTILRNISVLAIDQVVDERSKDDKGKATLVGKTATLELDPAEAEILTSAQAKGSISLSLRSAADDGDQTRAISSKTPRIIRAGRSDAVK